MSSYHTPPVLDPDLLHKVVEDIVTHGHFTALWPDHEFAEHKYAKCSLGCDTDPDNIACYEVFDTFDLSDSPTKPPLRGPTYLICDHCIDQAVAHAVLVRAERRRRAIDKRVRRRLDERAGKKQQEAPAK